MWTNFLSKMYAVIGQLVARFLLILLINWSYAKIVLIIFLASLLGNFVSQIVIFHVSQPYMMAGVKPVKIRKLGVRLTTPPCRKTPVTKPRKPTMVMDGTMVMTKVMS